MRVIKKFGTPADVAQAAADLFVYSARQAIKDHGVFSVALSGGSTPQAFFARLAEPPFGLQLPWPEIHIFWVDERPVPPEHPESNYRLAFQFLLARMPVPLENIHRIRGELDPQVAAEEYSAALAGYFNLPLDAQVAGDSYSFDLVYLGMGEDGHTASLFPGTQAVMERQRWVAANYVERLSSWRITLTAPAMNRARRVAFLVTGDKKRMKVREVLQSPYQPDELPAQLIKPRAGELFWLLDDSAGSLISIK